MVKQTSLDAYIHLINGGKATNQREKVFQVLIDYPRTRAEIAECTGLTINAVCGRVNEMLSSGVLEVAGVRQCKITGRNVEEIRVAEKSAS